MKHACEFDDIDGSFMMGQHMTQWGYRVGLLRAVQADVMLNFGDFVVRIVMRKRRATPRVTHLIPSAGPW